MGRRFAAVLVVGLVACADSAAAQINFDLHEAAGARSLQRWILGPGQDLQLDEALQISLAAPQPSWQEGRQAAWKLNEILWARFQTWYGRDEILALLGWLKQHESAPAESFADESIDQALRWLVARGASEAERDPHAAQVLLEAVRDDPLTRHRLSGLTRVLFSPSLVRQLLKQSYTIADCLDQWESRRPTEPPPLEACFRLPIDPRAAVVKLRWMPLDGAFPVFDTSRTAFAAQYQAGEWRPRQWWPSGPSADTLTHAPLYAQRVPSGQVFGLVAMHLMVKASADWHWQTLWWSDEAAEDFGSDQSLLVRSPVDSELRSFKLCAVAGFDAESADVVNAATGLTAMMQDLAAARTGRSWCSNPYLETGPASARTNCVGCHQHAGSELDPERILRFPSTFPSDASVRILPQSNFDYLWSLSAGGQLAYAMRQIVRH